MKLGRFSAFALTGLIVSLGVSTPAPAAVAWTITRLTYDSYFDSDPQVSGSNVVWYGSDGHDTEIFMYDGSTTLQLTNNGYHDRHPQVSGSMAVWDSDQGIFWYDGSTVSQLAGNGADPRISGPNIYWRDPSGDVLYHYDGTTTNPLGVGFHPDADGSKVVFSRLGDIFMHDVSTGLTTQITDNTYNDSDPKI